MSVLYYKTRFFSSVFIRFWRKIVFNIAFVSSRTIAILFSRNDSLESMDLSLPRLNLFLNSAVYSSILHKKRSFLDVLWYIVGIHANISLVSRLFCTSLAFTVSFFFQLT